MTSFTSWLSRRRAMSALTILLSSLLSPAAGAQTTGAADLTHAHAAGAAQTNTASAPDKELQKQLDELRAQVARLQVELARQQQPNAPPSGGVTTGAQTGSATGGSMGQMGMRKGEMGMSEMSMSTGGPGMMDMHKGEMGMPPEGMKMPDNMMMGEMGMGSMSGGSGTPGAGGMNMGGSGATAGGGAQSGMAMGGSSSGSGMSSAPRASRAPRSMSSLPGVPGSSHLYHIGSTGFFLDQSAITLTTEQQAALNRIKERALLERGNAERRIEQAEQELWALTGADLPDAAKVQAKVQEIEQLRTNERLAFIRAVGDATKQVTPEQRDALLGTATPKK